jgi:hypothetical protein
MTDTQKILDAAMAKAPSEFCRSLIQYQKGHAELMVNKYSSYVKFFEDNLDALCRGLRELNFSRKKGWQKYQTVQGLFLIRVPRTLFSAFQQVMNGDYYESLATCRIAYESILRILFIQKYPSDWSSTLLQEKGKRQFKASKFIVEDLRITDEDHTYALLSFPTHSHKQYILADIRKGLQGHGILLDLGYEFSERDMTITFRNLLALLYFALRVFGEFFGKFIEQAQYSVQYPVALEAFLKDMPNRFAKYPGFVDKALAATREDSIG